MDGEESYLDMGVQARATILKNLDVMYDLLPEEIRAKTPINKDGFKNVFDLMEQLFILDLAGADSKLTIEEAGFLDKVFKGMTIFHFIKGGEKMTFASLVGSDDYQELLEVAKNFKELNDAKALVSAYFALADLKTKDDSFKGLCDCLVSLTISFLRYTGDADSIDSDFINQRVHEDILGMIHSAEKEAAKLTEGGSEKPSDEAKQKPEDAERKTLHKNAAFSEDEGGTNPQEEPTKTMDEKEASSGKEVQPPSFSKADEETQAKATPGSLKEIYLRQHPTGKRD
jgi:hypothetical protein